VLCHAANLTVSGVPGYESGCVLPSLVEILDGLRPANTPPIRRAGPPGREHRYSGGGYVLLQQLLQDVTTIPFAELAAEAVLLPAGMAGATFTAPENGVVAPGRVEGREVHWRVHPEQAAAGLWCTPTDLVRFAKAIQASVCGDPAALLPPELAQDLLTPQVADWGLGLRLAGQDANRRFSHGGQNHGYECVLIGTVMGGNAVAVMTGSDHADPLLSCLLEALRDNTSWHDLPTRRDGLTW